MIDTNLGRFGFATGRRGAADALSAACGLLWGLLGYYLLENSRQGLTQALLLWPVIGVLIGRVARPAAARGALAHAWISLRDLYLAVTLFAVAEWTSVAFGPVAPHHWPPSRLGTTVVIMLWGLTFLGFVVILWPLSYVTHRLVWWAGEGRGETPADASVDLGA